MAVAYKTQTTGCLGAETSAGVVVDVEAMVRMFGMESERCRGVGVEGEGEGEGARSAAVEKRTWGDSDSDVALGDCDCATVIEGTA
jgi:hypothetical protein